MTAPITSETSQFSHTTFLEPAICRPRQGIAHPPLNPRPIWRNEDPQEHNKVPSVGPTLFEGDSFSSRSYSSSFLRSSAGHHSNNQCLPPPLTEPSSPRPYLEFGSMQPYTETPQYYLTSTNPHTSSSSPTFPLRPSDDWSLTRTPSFSSSQDSFWGPSHSVLSGVSGLSHRRSYSTISSDAVSTPTRETDSQISPVASEPPWDQLCIEIPSPHRSQHDSLPTPRAPIAPWINENVDCASPARPPVSTARLRATQACQKCRIRKAKCDGKAPCKRCVSRGLDCEYALRRRTRGPNKKPSKNRRREEDTFYTHETTDPLSTPPVLREHFDLPHSVPVPRP